MEDIQFEHPRNLIGAARVVAIVGSRGCGKSHFIKSFDPDVQTVYAPIYYEDKKRLVEFLSSQPTDILVGIETSLPSIRVSGDSLLRELALMSKIKRHTYLIEWTENQDQWEKFICSTYGLMFSTAFGVINSRLGVISTGRSDPRFASIAARLSPSKDWIFEYQLLRKDSEEPINALRFKYNRPEND